MKTMLLTKNPFFSSNFKIFLSALFYLIILSTSHAQDNPAGSLDFDGVDDYVAIGDFQITGAFTIEAWIKPNEKTDFSTIISNKFGGGSNPGFTFSINNFASNDGKLVFEGQSTVASTDFQAITWGNWQHVAVSSDGNTVNFYVNGIQQSASSNSVSLASSGIPANIGDVGVYFGNGHFDGAMDELRVWNYQRSASEINASRDCTLDQTEFGLRAYYNFNQGISEGTNTSISSLVSTNGPIGSLQSFGLTGSSSNFLDGGVPACSLCFELDGAGLNFDGIDDFVNIGDLQILGPFTIEAWVKPNEKTDFSTILSNKTGGTNPGFSFTINSFNTNDGALVFESQGIVAKTTFQAVTWGEWQHVAITSDGNTAQFFVNANEQEVTDNTVSLSSSVNDTKIGDFGIYFGNGHFDGAMDELRVWNFAKTGDQIQVDRNCEISPQSEGLLAYYRFNQGIAQGDNSNINQVVAEAGNSGDLSGFSLACTSGNFIYPGAIDCQFLSVQDFLTKDQNLGQIYPNPMKSGTTANISIDQVSTNQILIEVYNSIGQKEIQIQNPMVRDNQIIELNLSSLPRGIHFVTFMIDQQKITRKLVIE